MSPNNNPIISNLINAKNPITTSPTAREEWARSPNSASPGRLVFFWSWIKINAIADEIIKTEIAILNSNEYAIVTPSKAECERVSPK